MNQEYAQFRDKDQPRRTREILQEPWRIGEDNPAMCTAEPILAIKTRLGASIVYDCLAIWRYGKRGEQATARSNQTTAALPDIQEVHEQGSVLLQDNLDFPVNMDDFDNLMLDYMTLPWAPNFNDAGIAC